MSARNNQRDRINDKGAARFAKDHGMKLTDFHSRDELAGNSGSKDTDDMENDRHLK